MELIIKPTGRCNFCCTFCSASEIKTCDDITHVPQILRKYIKRAKPEGLIVTGGDPLMMDPAYYYELHNVLDDGLDISATTNLKDFYLHPDKWKQLFNEPWFRITTSFQYGSGRMWDKNTVYDEDMFIKVMQLYKELVNKPLPSFIAVINKENERFAIDHVRLAKRLGTNVKMNNALPVGRNEEWYPRYKMFRIYLDLINKYNLSDYEANCVQRNMASCPRNIFNDCSTNIRCVYVDHDGKLHVGICDELLVIGEELTGDDVYGGGLSKPIDPSKFIKDDCAYCRLCRLCNGCNMNRKFAKEDPNYCSEMKKLESEIVDAGWIL